MYHFSKKVLGSRISLAYNRLNENLTTNLGKISQSFQNWAPDVLSPVGHMPVAAGDVQYTQQKPANFWQYHYY